MKGTTQQITPRRRRRTRWSYAAGKHGSRVSAFVERNGRLYGMAKGKKVTLELWDSPANRERAEAWADDQADQLRKGLESVADPVPTVAKVFALYLATQTPRKKSATTRYQDERAAEMFTRVLGAGKDLRHITLDAWQRFIDARASGAIDPRGRPVPTPVKKEDPQRRTVRPRAVEGDLEWLRLVIRWAVKWRDESGRYLMAEDPTRGYAIPTEKNPRRPIATQDRYELVSAQAPTVDADLVDLLAIVNGSGHRIGAVLELRGSDLRHEKTTLYPEGATRWRADADKIGKEWIVPNSPALRATFDRLLARRPVIGDGYLFPHPALPGRALTYDLACVWLEKAERLAKVPKLTGGRWHPYRRKWGTERKHLPVQDVAFAGGWKNTATLATIYQQPDPVTTYRVMSEPVALRDRKAADA
jgi:hypothetical protein